MDKLKVILVLTGLTIIFGFLASYLHSKSPLDLFFITIGMMTVIFGFHIEKEKFNETATYFVAMSCVNVSQWLILIYIFFNNQLYLMENFFYLLVGALLFTITLIIQIRRSDLKYFGNSQKINKDVILADRIKLMLNDKARLMLMIIGIVIMLGCLASYSQSTSLLELFGASVGMLILVYGLYRKDKKTNITFNYFFFMSCVIIFQWFILAYIFFSGIYVGDGSIDACTIAIVITLFFYIQIRESDLKYIGKRRKLNISNR